VDALNQIFHHATFERARQGDLVIVPPKSFTSDALVGEFVDGPFKSVNVKVDRLYLDDSLPGRRVKWLASIPKRKLPIRVIEAIQKPSAFFLLARSLRQEIYQQAYPSFVLGDELYTSRFDVISLEFKAKDDFIIQSFFNFVAANTKAIAEGREGEVLDLPTAAFSDTGTYDPDLKTNVNSPGWLSLFSKHATPLIAAALLAIAMEIPPAAAVEAANQGTIVIGNPGAAPTDQCAQLVQSHVINHMAPRIGQVAAGMRTC
jgi:hypothetical protein